MASIINASSTGAGGIIQTADASGVLQLQSNGVTALSTSGANVTIAGTLTTASQSIAKASLPTGSVLQVVNGSYNLEVSTALNALVDTNLTASITPLFSTSKILCIVNMCGVAKAAGNTQTNLGFYLLRGASTIIQFEYTACYTNTSLELRGGSVSTTYLDSPATTSSTTYKVQFNSNGGTGTGYVQKASSGTGGSTSTSTITLMEIAA